MSYKIAAMLCIVVLSLVLMGSIPDVGVNGNRLEVGINGRVVGLDYLFVDVDITTLGQDLIAGEYWTPTVDFSAGTKYYFDPTLDPTVDARGDGSIDNPFYGLGYEAFADTVIERRSTVGGAVANSANSPVVGAGDVCVLLNGNHGKIDFAVYAFDGYLGIVAAPSDIVTFDYIALKRCIGVYVEGVDSKRKIRSLWDVPGTGYNDAPNFVTASLDTNGNGISSNIIFNNCTFSSASKVDAAAWGGKAWNDNTVNGIYISRTVYAHIQDCTFNVVNYGIQITGTSVLESEYINLLNNRIDYFNGDGIQVSRTDSVGISGNYIIDAFVTNENHVDMFQAFFRNDNTFLSNNTFIARSDPYRDEEGLFVGTRPAYFSGVWFSTTDSTYSATIQNNIVSIGDYIGINIAGGSDCIISNNTVVIDTVATAGHAPIIKFVNASTDCIVSNNITSTYTAQSGVTAYSNLEYDYDFSTAGFVNYEAGTDPSTWDLSLISTSPSIDVGSSMGAPYTDYAELCRPYGGYWDVGAYEYDDGSICGATYPVGADHQWDATVSSSLTLATDDIVAWADRKGAWDWADSLGTNRPSARAADTINGNQAIYFDGTEWLMRNSGFIGASDYTVAMVVDNTGRAGSVYSWNESASASGKVTPFGQSSTETRVIQNVVVPTTIDDDATDGYHIIVTTYDVSDADISCYVDGVAVLIDGTASSNSEATQVTLGSRWTGESAYAYIGAIGEVIIYDTELSAEDAHQLYNYLKRWDSDFTVAAPPDTTGTFGYAVFDTTNTEDVEIDVLIGPSESAKAWVQWKNSYDGTYAPASETWTPATTTDRVFITSLATSIPCSTLAGDTLYVRYKLQGTAPIPNVTEWHDLTTPIAKVFVRESTEAPTSPTISSVTGTIATGDTLVIAGGAFGTKATAAPLKFDDFESGSDGVLFSAGGDWFVQTDNAVADQPKYSSANQRSAASSLNAEFYSTRAAGDYGWDYIYDTNIDFSGGSIYLDYWVRFSLAAPTATLQQHKMARIAMGTPASSGAVFPELYMQSYADVYSQGTKCGGAAATNYGVNAFASGSWQHFSIELGSGTVGVADGYYNIWQDGELVAEETSIDWHDDGSCGDFESIWIGSYIGNCDASMYTTHYYDDIYYDNTFARIEIGDNPVYANCTHREIQIPIAWAADEVSVVANLGSIGSGDRFVFLIDADGTVSNSIKITVP